MLIKSKLEIDILREGGKRLAAILEEVALRVKPGISTLDLDILAERLIFECGGVPAFKGYRIREAKIPYPASICVSVNDEVVHGIPRKNRILREGDIVGLDIGMKWPSRSITNNRLPVTDGLYTDMAVTVGVGKISKEAARLINATKEALSVGIDAAKAGARIGDIGAAIQACLSKQKLGIIRDLAGHGVGYQLHEKPLIPNYGKAGTGPVLQDGMVIAIEPMATLGGWRITLDDDQWTFRTADGSISAHFEHTVAVTKDGAEVLTVV